MINPESSLAELLNEFHSATSAISCKEFAIAWLNKPLENADIDDLQRLCKRFDVKVPALPVKADLVNMRAVDASALECESCHNINRENCAKVFPVVENGRIKVRKQICNLKRVQTLIYKSHIPEKFYNIRDTDFTVTPDNMSVAKKALELCNMATPRKGLFIYGNVGVGKTMLSSIIAIERAYLGKPSLFYTVTDMLTDLRDFDDSVGRQIKLSQIKNTPCLIIDDLGAEYVTDWVSSTLFDILDARYKSNLCTVINSNIAIGNIQARYGELHGSRIVRRIQELCECVWLW